MLDPEAAVVALETVLAPDGTSVVGGSSDCEFSALMTGASLTLKVSFALHC